MPPHAQHSNSSGNSYLSVHQEATGSPHMTHSSPHQPHTNAKFTAALPYTAPADYARAAWHTLPGPRTADSDTGSSARLDWSFTYDEHGALHVLADDVVRLVRTLAATQRSTDHEASADSLNSIADQLTQQFAQHRAENPTAVAL